MRFVDSHLHLDGPETGNMVAIARATETLLLTCGVDRRTSEAGLKLAHAAPLSVKAFVGVHPSEVLHDFKVGWLRSALKRATGLGEIGLDPKYSGVGTRGVQLKVFTSQLEAAEKEGKPVQVHSRRAERECMDALARFRLRAVLMHWLQEEGILSEAVGRGYFVSFGPALLYSKRLQRMAARCDTSRVLAETDSPVSYGPLGGVYGPSLIPSVVFRLAEAWGMHFEEARALTTQNAMRFQSGTGKG